MSRPRKIKKPKYKVGDEVYSYQNPTVKRPITMIREPKEPGFDPAYKLSLKTKDGYTRSSNWINESSLYKRRRKY